MKWIYLCFLLALAWSRAQAQSWSELGPSNRAGVIKQLYADDPTKNLYALSHDGGLWVYDDFTTNTLTWRPITDMLDNLEMRAFAVGKGAIYVANRKFGLYKTTNGGSSWTQTSFTKGMGLVNMLAVPYNTPATIYAATSNGLYRSTNSGSTWDALLTAANVTDIDIDPDSSQILYAGVRRQGLRKSQTGGALWSTVLPWNQTSGPERIMIDLGFRHTNGTLQTPATRTVAVKLGRQVWLSTSGGNANSFTNTNFVANLAGGASRTDTEIFGDWCSTIRVNPFNGNEIWVGDEIVSVGIMANNSMSWQVINTTANYVHEDQHDFAFSKSINGKMFKASDGGVAIRVPDELRFTNFSAGLKTFQFLALGINQGLFVGNVDHNGVMGTDDISSGNWNRVSGSGCHYGNNALEFCNIYADPKRPNRFYMLHKDNVIVRIKYPFDPNCLNGGALDFGYFTPYFLHGEASQDEFRNRISFPYGQVAVDTREDATLMLACAKPSASSYSIMYTLQANQEPAGGPRNEAPITNVPTWSTALTSDNDPFVTVKFAAPGSNRFYALTEKGILYSTYIPVSTTVKFASLKESDVASVISTTSNWKKNTGLVSSTPLLNFDVNRFADSVVYAVSTNAFHYSNNGGRTWTTKLRNIPVDNYYTVLAHPTNRDKVFLSTSEGVYLTSNNGSSWTKLRFNLPNVKVLQIQISGSYLYAVTYGRGLWRIPWSSL